MTFSVRVMIDTGDKSVRSGKRVRKRRLRSKIAIQNTDDLKVGVVFMKAIRDDSLQLFTESLTQVIEEISLR